MSSKKKGTRYERELFHMLWENDFACCRVAGSGSSTKPSPDLIAANKSRIIAIECKSIKGDAKYLSSESIKELIDFSEKFGAEPWFAIRFDKYGWFFLPPSEVEETNNGNSVVSLEHARKKGIKFEELVKL